MKNALFFAVLLCAVAARAQTAPPATANPSSAPPEMTPPPAPLPPPPPPPKKWKDAGEASYVSTNGNTRTTTTAAKDTFTYDFDKFTQLVIEGGALGARSAGATTAEQYYAGEKAEQKIGDNDYLFERFRWDRNVFAGIAAMNSATLGAGRTFWNTKSNVFNAEAGPGFVNEERVGENHQDYASARAYAKYQHVFNPTASFSQDAEYLQNLQTSNDLHFNTVTALTTTLTSVFSIKTSFTWKHWTAPPPGFIKDDTTTGVALIANF
jgi:putative salt-induced outer membrane protein YdiY